MKTERHSLHLTLLYCGVIYDEHVVRSTPGSSVTLGTDANCRFALCAPELPESLECFERLDDGVALRFTDRTRGVVEIGGEEFGFSRLVESGMACEVGTVDTDGGRSAVYEVRLRPGERGLLKFGDVTVVFQIAEKRRLLPGKRAHKYIAKPIVATLAVALLVHVAFVVNAFLTPPPQPLPEYIEIRTCTFGLELPDEEDESNDSPETVGNIDDDDEISDVVGILGPTTPPDGALQDVYPATYSAACVRDDIQNVIEERSHAIRYCFERRMEFEPGLGGEMSVDWRIESNGAVTGVRIPESTVDESRVENCVRRVVERMEFAEPDGARCDVRYPLVFTGI